MSIHTVSNIQLPLFFYTTDSNVCKYPFTGANPGFQVRGAHLKILRRAEGGAKIVWGISCEKSRFYAKKSYFSNFRGGAQNVWGISCEKSRFYAKKIIFLPILGGPPPLNPPLIYTATIVYIPCGVDCGS